MRSFLREITSVIGGLLVGILFKLRYKVARIEKAAGFGDFGN